MLRALILVLCSLYIKAKPVLKTSLCVKGYAYGPATREKIFTLLYVFFFSHSLQIATFFSNNLDFFISSAGYGPRGGTGSLNPQQAHSMLSNKKHASDYMLALRRVSGSHLLLFSSLSR